MNNPVAFEQDPAHPDGTGTFRFEDGSELYARDPDLSQQILARIRQAPDLRTAENAHAPRADVQVGRRPDPLAAFNAPRSDAPAQSSVDPRFFAGGDEGLPARFTPKPAEAAAPPQPTSQERQGVNDFLHQLNGGGAPAQPTPRQPPPRPMIGGRDPAREAALAVPVPTKSSITIEGNGAPYSLEDARARQAANQDVQAAKLAEFGVQKARADTERARLEAELPSLRQQASEQQAALDRLDAVYRHERATVQDHIAQFDKSAKPDPERFFKDKGTLLTIGMAIMQGLGAYAAIVGHGDNYASKIVQGALDRDYQAQLDEIREGRISQQNMLARLADQLGDLDQARSALKLIQGQVVDREIKSNMAAAASDDAVLAGQSWLALNAQQRLKDEQEFRDRSIGKTTTTTSADMVVPRSPHRMTDDEIIAQQTKENKLRSGLLESQNELGYQGQGGDQAGKVAKREGDKAANDELYVEGFGTAKTKAEAIQLRSAIAEHEAREKMLDRMSELNHKAWTGVPSVGNLATEETIEGEGLRNRFVSSLARSYGGPITESDTKRAEQVAPDPTSWFSGNQDVKIRTAREESRDKLNANIRAIVSGKHAELPETRKERE